MFNGVRDFTSPSLRTNIPTLAEALHRSGYQTAAFVSSLVLNSMWGLNRGFDLYDDNVGIDTNRERFLFLVQRRGDLTTRGLALRAGHLFPRARRSHSLRSSLLLHVGAERH